MAKRMKAQSGVDCPSTGDGQDVLSDQYERLLGGFEVTALDDGSRHVMCEFKAEASAKVMELIARIRARELRLHLEKEDEELDTSKDIFPLVDTKQIREETESYTVTAPSVQELERAKQRIRKSMMGLRRPNVAHRPLLDRMTNPKSMMRILRIF